MHKKKVMPRKRAKKEVMPRKGDATCLIMYF
jgi:hypothetical protein